MKVISIDVGIKNMAYCILEVSDEAIGIKDWRVVSFMNPENTVVYHCNCFTKKTKRSPEKMCGRIAKYRKGEQRLFCDKHAKTQTEYIFPKNIKKMKLEEIKGVAAEYGIENAPKKRVDIVAAVEEYQNQKGLEPVLKTKEARANDTDLILIGNNIKRVLNGVLREHTEITHVLIENQISPLANRMKTVQGMLAQYFIMCYDRIEIEFISSANKLKMFQSTQTGGEPQTQSQKYKKHKKDGILYCEQVLVKNKWVDGFWRDCETKKRDDLADCFLQGVWWINRKYPNTIQI
jgi:hypothetical protein